MPLVLAGSAVATRILGLNVPLPGRGTVGDRLKTCIAEAGFVPCRVFGHSIVTAPGRKARAQTPGGRSEPP